jgi:predicted PurR-regulated permease PerM
VVSEDKERKERGLMSVKQTPSNVSPPWSNTTKALITFLLLVLFGFLLVRFRSVLIMILLAVILNFLITPLVRHLSVHARLSWAAATNICFIFLILFIVVSSTAIGLVVVQQLQALFLATQKFFVDLSAQIESASHQLIQIGPWVIDFSQFNLDTPFEEAITYVELVLGQASSLIAGVATVAIETIAHLVFTIVVAYFLTLDYERFRDAWRRLSIPGFEADIDRLRRALAKLWDAFLRGQLVVVTITGLLTWGLMSILGVRFSLGLGVLGGVAKFVPIVGPTVGGSLAAVVALLQPDNYLHLTPLAHSIMVVICVILLDQSIDYLIMPRIMGTSLNLHPVIIIVGALLGATLAGILGLLLSAPAMATLILFGKYIFRKLVDQSPWDPPIDDFPEIKERAFVRFLRKKKEEHKKQNDHSEE